MTRTILLLAALFLSACATVPPPSQGRPIALGYVPAFRGLEPIAAAADFAPYTHIAIAFVNPDSSGAVVAGEDMACMPGPEQAVQSRAALRAAAAKAHRAGGKVLISLGGGTIPTCSGDWAALLRPERRAEVVRNLVALVDAEALDGIDVDLEGELLTRIDREGNFTPFVAELGAALRERGKLLTCATASYEGGMVPVSSVPWFDLVGVMSYDAMGPTWGEPGGEHSSYAQAEKDLALWRSRGVPREKLLLGIPFYGYGYGSYRPNYDFRQMIEEFGREAMKDEVVGERCPGCSYITFNGLDTLARKGRLAREQAGGVMVWEVSKETGDNLAIRTVIDGYRQGRGQ